MNSNEYDPRKCLDIVQQFGIEDALLKKYGKRRLCYQQSFLTNNSMVETPRQHLVSPAISMCSFYYLKYLLEKNPTEIVDIGCGMNFFKNILPVSVHGIDGNGAYDEKALFDENFLKSRKNLYEAVMSIDALHFIPLHKFQQRLIDFSSIIKPGGRGYLAMNVARMVEFSSDNELEDLMGENWHTDKQIFLRDFVFKKIKTSSMKFLVVDCLIDQIYDEYIDGNIRLVIER